MVSCTEFIPLYSELFKYIDEKGGHDAVVRYWRCISEQYVRPRLGVFAAKKGLQGCWEYWEQSLNEEAADFVMKYDDEAQTFSIYMRYCPSAGMLNSFEHMEPYHDYCGHCSHLYAPILEELGIKETDDGFVDQKAASCRLSFYIPKENDG